MALCRSLSFASFGDEGAFIDGCRGLSPRPQAVGKAAPPGAKTQSNRGRRGTPALLSPREPSSLGQRSGVPNRCRARSCTALTRRSVPASPQAMPQGRDPTAVTPPQASATSPAQGPGRPSLLGALPVLHLGPLGPHRSAGPLPQPKASMDRPAPGRPSLPINDGQNRPPQWAQALPAVPALEASPPVARGPLAAPQPPALQ